MLIDDIYFSLSDILHSVGGESGMTGESGIDIYIPPCVKQLVAVAITTRSPTWHSMMIYGVVWSRGRKLKRKRTYIKLWLIQAVVQQKSTQHCKAIFLQLKKNFK